MHDFWLHSWYEAIFITFFELLSYSSHFEVSSKVAVFNFLENGPVKNVHFWVNSINDFDHRFQITYFLRSFPRNNKFYIFATSSRSSHQSCSVKRTAFLKFRNIYRKTPVLESLFNKAAGLKGYNFVKKWLQHRCFLWILENF